MVMAVRKRIRTRTSGHWGLASKKRTLGLEQSLVSLFGSQPPGTEGGRRDNGGTTEGRARGYGGGWKECWDAAKSDSGRSVGRNGRDWF